MNTKNQKNLVETKGRVPGVWSRSVRACRNWATKMSQLREQLIMRVAEEAKGRLSESMIGQAITEAEALACSTQYPLLFLPILAEEKISSAQQHAERQREILRRQKTLAGIF